MVANDVWKFVLLGVPAIIMLLMSRKTGVTNRTMYHLSCASPVCYVIWVVGFTAFRQIISQRPGGWMTNGVGGLFLFAPLFGVLFSLLLLVCVLFASKTQRFEMAGSNAFMLTLWAASIIMPN